jgi:chromosome partitioning protein
MILSLVSLKGGVGKTTSAMYLAACAVEDELNPIVLDADEEASALSWAALATSRNKPLPWEVITPDRNSLAKQARALEKKGHCVIIDTPPNNREVLTIAGMVSDLVIVPVSPSGVEMDRLKNTIALLENVEAARGSLTHAVLLTQYDGRRLLAIEAQEALEDFSVFNSRIRDLARYKTFGTMPDYLFEYRQAWQEAKEAM